jgi:hypothetical protein
MLDLFTHTHVVGLTHQIPLCLCEAPTTGSKQQSEVEMEFAKRYQEALAPHQFGETDMKDENGEYRHHFKTRIKTDINPSPKKLKRLIQEISAFNFTTQPNSFSSFVPFIDMKYLHIVRFIENWSSVVR